LSILHGSIPRYLLTHAAIIFVGLAGLSSLSLIDVYFVGKLGALELEAISYSTPVFLIALSLLMGLGTGIVAALAPAIGEGRKNKIAELILTALLLAVVLGLGLWGGSSLLHSRIFQALGLPDEHFGLLTPYMMVIYGGLALIAGLIGLLSILRAYGDTRPLTLVMSLVVILNALLDPLLILGWGDWPGLGLVGAAWATCIALGIGLLLSLFFFLRFAPEKLPFSLSLYGLKVILKVALPAAVTRTFLPLCSALVIRVLAEFGPKVVAAYGIGYRLDVVLLMWLVACSSVLAPFVGQNLGAEQFGRLRQGVRFSLWLALGYGLAVALVLGLLRAPLAAAFTDDPEIRQMLETFWLWVPWGYAFGGILILSTAVLNALYRPFQASLLGSIHLFAIYLPLVFAAWYFFSYPQIWFAYPLASVMAALLGLWWVRQRILRL
jgi:putative MATE family efflux protein